MTNTPRSDDFSNIEIYLVGGAVRDRIMGIKPKDLDFTIVANSFEQMQAYLIDVWGVESFLVNKRFGTIRGKFGTNKNFADINVSEQACDFVLARRDGFYSDGRRPDSTTLGTLHDDLARRDFTVNAIALDAYGNYIDPFNGQLDIENMELIAVGSAQDRFMEDALRALRALRFQITKGFKLDADIVIAMRDGKVLNALADNVSTDRVREEIYKCMKHDTAETIYQLVDKFRSIRAVVFGQYGHNIWLEPTNKER